jgi:hypothetical protein
VFAWPVLLSLALQAPTVPPPAPPPAAQAPAPTPPVDPAVATFSTSTGLLLVAVKADKTADYEAVMTALQSALAASTDPARRSLAQGWRVFKAAEADAKGNVLYVHALFPAVAGADYRPSLLLDQLLAEPPAELLAKYKEALAGPPTRLSLTELAHMAMAPVKK